MKNEELEAITNSIKEKLGDENTALISDDLGLLITKNTEVYNSSINKDKEIARIKDDKEKLVIANGRLLQQVSMGVDDTPKKKEEEKSSFSFKDAFDEKGNFKK